MAEVRTAVLDASMVDAAGQVLGRAFFDDPMFVYIEPDDDRRRAVLPWFFARGAQLGQQFGRVERTEGDLLGAAVWLPPGSTDIPDERMASVGFHEAPQRLGEAAFGRFARVMEHFVSVHERSLEGAEHWYLVILGVEPARQGRGIGSGLMAPGLARADRDAMPCYLETTKDRNVVLYERHGFEVVEKGDVPGGGPTYWGMRRQARAPA